MYLYLLPKIDLFINQIYFWVIPISYLILRYHPLASKISDSHKLYDELY